MAANQFVVKGEAAESDSDEEVSAKPVSIIDGEASESDDDPDTFNLKPLTLRSMPSSSSTPSTFSSGAQLPEDLSLLQSRLVEANLSLYANLEKAVSTTCANATRELTSADLLLQSSQVHLRSATQTIRQVREHSAQLLERSNHILESRFLANVKIIRNSK